MGPEKCDNNSNLVLVNECCHSMSGKPGSLWEHSAQMSDPLFDFSSLIVLLESPSRTSGPERCSHTPTTSPEGSPGIGSAQEFIQIKLWHPVFAPLNDSSSYSFIDSISGLTLSLMRPCRICQRRFMAPSLSAKSVLSLRLLSTSWPLICSTDWLTKSTVSCLQLKSTLKPWEGNSSRFTIKNGSHKPLTSLAYMLICKKIVCSWKILFFYQKLTCKQSQTCNERPLPCIFAGSLESHLTPLHSSGFLHPPRWHSPSMISS